MTDLFMRRSAIFSPDGQHRLRLERRWRPGPIVAFGMCNPSTADAEREDPTLWRIIKFAQRWGFGGLLVFNHNTYITPHPEDLFMWSANLGSRDPAEFLAYSQRCIDTALAVISEADLVVAAWGNPGAYFDRWCDIFKQRLVEAGADLHHLGLTAGGHPKHPLARGKHRIPDNQKPIRWWP